MKKILLIFTLILSVAFSGGYVYADDAIYEQKTQETIAPGVTLTRVNAFYSGYNLTYSYVTADLTQPKNSLTLLKSNEGINVRDTVANLAKTEPNVVAAVNADFFSMTQKSFSQGLEYKNGRILQSPIDTNSFAGGFLYNDKLVLSNLGFHIMIVAPNLNYREVYRINKPMEAFGELLMYTSDYNKDHTSPAPGNGVVEMLVEDGVVKQFNESKTPMIIPENGYVLEISAAVGFLKENFNIGDSVKVEKYVNPSLDNLTMAFGGGSLLLKDGQIVKFTNNISGNNPRSAVGTNDEKNKVYLMCVDGRQSTSRGVTQTQLAQLMKKIGCTNAMNLDGGGSSNMVSKTWDNASLQTVNSPTENRKVINAIGITNNEEKTGKLAHLKLEADADTMFEGSSIKLKLSGTDSSYSHVEINQNDAVFNSENVNNMRFVQTAGGEYEIYAQLDGVVSNSVKIKVISDDLAGIRVAPIYKLKNVGDSTDLYLTAYDEEGNYVGAWYNRFDISVTGDAAEFKDGKVIAKKPGEAVIEIKKGNVKSYTKVQVGSGYEDKYVRPADVVSDSKNKAINDAEKVFAYVGVADTQTTLFDGLYTSKLAEILKKYNQVGILGNQNHRDFDDIYAVNYDKYMCLRKDWAVFLSLPAVSGSVRSADASAFDKIRSDLKASAEPNVFVTCDTYLNMSGMEFEALKSVFKETKKNVFVIQRGEANSVRIVDGIRFFTVADNKGLSNLSEKVLTSKVLKFYVKSANVTYSFENIY